MLWISVINVWTNSIFVSMDQIRHFFSFICDLMDGKLLIFLIQSTQNTLYKLYILFFFACNYNPCCLWFIIKNINWLLLFSFWFTRYHSAVVSWFSGWILSLAWFLFWIYTIFFYAKVQILLISAKSTLFNWLLLPFHFGLFTLDWLNLFFYLGQIQSTLF